MKEMIDMTFMQPKVRLGNKTMTREQLDAHKRDNSRQYNLSVRDKYDKDYTKFYQSKEWRKTRSIVLTKHMYMCKQCVADGLAVNRSKRLIVHHVIELKDDWDKRLDADNLEVLCGVCHNKLHKRKY